MTEDDKALIVSIEARLSKLDKGLDKAYRTTSMAMRKMEREAAKAAKKMDSSLSGAFVGLQSKLAGLATLAASAFSLVSIRNALNVADEISDTAQRLGISTDALQEWRFAAQEAGLEAANFDAALEGFRSKIGAVIAELPRAKVTGDILGRLGLSAEDLTRAGTAENQLRMIADALRGIDDINIRTAIADRLGLRELLPLLSEGSQGIDTFIAKARDMGIVMDRDMVQRGADAQRQVEILAQAISVQLNEALIALAPILVSIGGGLLQLAQLARQAYDLITSIPKITGGGPGTIFSEQESQLRNLQDLYETVRGQAEDAKAELHLLASGAQSPTNDLETDTAALKEFVAERENYLDTIKAEIDAARPASEAQRVMREGIWQIQAALATVPPAAKPAAQAMNGVGNGLNQVGSAADKAAEKTKKALDAFEKLAAKRRDRSGEVADFLSWADGVSGEQTQKDWDALGVEAYAEARSSFASAFADGIMEGIQTGDWRGVLESALSEIANNFLRRALEDLGGALYDTINGMGGGGGGKSGLGGILSSVIGGLFGGGGGGAGAAWTKSGWGMFSGRASGGPVTAGTPYIVGEKRPELFVPNVSGRIVPRVPDMRGMGGSNSYTFAPVVDARGADMAAVARLEGALQRQQSEFQSWAKGEAGRTVGHVRNARQRRQLRV